MKRTNTQISSKGNRKKKNTSFDSGGSEETTLRRKEDDLGLYLAGPISCPAPYSFAHLSVFNIVIECFPMCEAPCFSTLKKNIGFCPNRFGYTIPYRVLKLCVGTVSSVWVQLRLASAEGQVVLHDGLTFYLMARGDVSNGIFLLYWASET